MANNNRRVNSRSEHARINHPYEDGNAVRKLSYDSDRGQPGKNTHKRKKKSKRSKGSTNAGRGYITALIVVLMLTMFSCVNYLQLKARLATQSAEIADMESELSQLKADNDAFYNTVIASVTLEEIKTAALERLGLHYAAQSQIRYYDLDDSGYVRQYTEVP